MSNDVIIQNTLPASFLALSDETMQQAMALCERGHAIEIPDPSVDEPGCRAAIDAANAIYESINGLSKQLEEARLEIGRQIKATLTDPINNAVRAATGPLEDQRAKIGKKIWGRREQLTAIIAEKERRAEAERRRLEEERRRAAEAAERAAAEAKRLQQEAEAAARAAAERAAAAAAAGEDAPPDDEAAAAAARAAEAATKAEQERAVAIDKVFDATPAPYIAPAPKVPIKRTVDRKLQIDDLTKVPREIGGVPLFKLDETVAEILLKKGVKIPGLSLVEVERIGGKGRAGAYAI